MAGQIAVPFGEPRWKRVPEVADVVLELRERDMLPAIYFIFSRAQCDNAALQLDQQACSFTTPEEQSHILYELESLR